MKNSLMLISAAMTILLLLTPTIASARHCGKVMGKRIETYGNLSCSRAKAVYQQFNDGNIPKGWMCGQSVGGCGIGKKGFTFK
jgi:hypothetical protein